MTDPAHRSSPFVKCPGCGAKLSVRAENAGKKGKCHECGQVFRIGGRPAAGAPAAAPARLAPPAAPSPPPSPRAALAIDNDHLHPVVCEVCQTLMYATDDEVGKLVKCPDCGHRNIAKRREAKRAAPQVLVADGDEYQLDEESPPPPIFKFTPIEDRERQFRAAARARHGIREPEEELDDDSHEERPRGKSKSSAKATDASRSTATRRDQRRPAVPVVQGVLRMMFTLEVISRWVGMSLALTGVMFAIGFVATAMGGMVFMAMWIFAGGCVLAGMWVVSSAPLLLAIITQSACGEDELREPPNWADFDFAETGFFVLAVASSGVPAWLASKGAEALPAEAQAAIGVGLWLITFPLVVLSALEQGSALAIFSPRIAASLVRCFVPWLAFTLVAVFSSVVAGGLCVFLLTRGSLFAVLPIPWIVVAWLLLYMRLIGRLGWWIADVMPPPAESEGP